MSNRLWHTPIELPLVPIDILSCFGWVYPIIYFKINGKVEKYKLIRILFGNQNV